MKVLEPLSKISIILVQMKKPQLSFFLLALFCLLLGCKTSTNNLCDGLMNESPPKRIGLVLIDKHTGNNLLQKNLINKEDIKITVIQTGSIFRNWHVITSSNATMNGMLELSTFHEKAGEYGYKIELNNLNSVDFSYIINQEKTNDPCKMYYYPMSDFKVLNHDFEQFQHEEKPSPDILVVQMDYQI